MQKACIGHPFKASQDWQSPWPYLGKQNRWLFSQARKSPLWCFAISTRPGTVGQCRNIEDIQSFIAGKKAKAVQVYRNFCRPVSKFLKDFIEIWIYLLILCVCHIWLFFLPLLTNKYNWGSFRRVAIKLHICGSVGLGKFGPSSCRKLPHIPPSGQNCVLKLLDLNLGIHDSYFK